MDIDEFRGIVTAFADTPASIDLSKGDLILQMHDDLIEARLEFSNGHDICVVENDTKYTAREWVLKRLARLPLLAERILAYVSQESNFVTPRGLLLDQLELQPEENETDVSDALEETRRMLGASIPGASSILYLTSDAGEGKTTLINQLARDQAMLYKRKSTDWLLVPIPLGGRSFLRFDDVVIGSLANRLRFQILYFEAFINLVRLGAIVPAFDGFEEMFVESSTGEAVSALGNLVKTLRSSGNVLISARKAYFEYRNFSAQSRLFDSIGPEDVRFARLSLKRWDRDNFISYASKRNISSGEAIYNDVSSVLGEEHPLLTRAVLVRRLLDVAAEITDRKSLLQMLGNNPDEYFLQFVKTIIEREVREKWIDRSGEPYQPLLSVDEHQELLSFLAEEMWINSVDTVREEHLDLVADLFCEANKKSATISRQVKDRINSHPLIVRSESYKHGYAFDHDDFRYHFLGEAISRHIISKSESELRNILQIGLLPNQVLDAANHYYRFTKHPILFCVELLLNICATERPGSFVPENVGGLLVRVLNEFKPSDTICIENIQFPVGALLGRELANLRFSRCYFQPTSMDRCNLCNCEFIEATFERIELSRDSVLDNVKMIDTKVNSIIPATAEETIFAPETIQHKLETIGFIFPKAKTSAGKPSIASEPDQDVVLAERAFRRFLRSTTVSAAVLKVKMGKDSNHFIKKLLPNLIQSGAIKIHTTEGSTHYRLGIPMQAINTSFAKAGGNFSKFLSLLNEYKEH
jgi:hypothetical protein